MLTKIKRIKRKKFAVGDEARKFENIPAASQPQQQKMGTRNQFVDKYVTEQIKSPELAGDAKQNYTQQTVQSNELLSGSTMASPTNVGTTTISGSSITAPSAITSTQVAAPASLTASTMTPASGTAQTGTAQTGTVGTQSQVGTVTGTLSGTATGATAAPSTTAVVQAQQGLLVLDLKPFEKKSNPVAVPSAPLSFGAKYLSITFSGSLLLSKICQFDVLSVLF